MDELYYKLSKGSEFYSVDGNFKITRHIVKEIREIKEYREWSGCTEIIPEHLCIKAVDGESFSTNTDHIFETNIKAAKFVNSLIDEEVERLKKRIKELEEKKYEY